MTTRTLCPCIVNIFADTVSVQSTCSQVIVQWSITNLVAHFLFVLTLRKPRVQPCLDMVVESCELSAAYCIHPFINDSATLTEQGEVASEKRKFWNFTIRTENCIFLQTRERDLHCVQYGTASLEKACRAINKTIFYCPSYNIERPRQQCSFHCEFSISMCDVCVCNLVIWS